MKNEQKILEDLFIFRECINNQLENNIANFGEEVVLSAESLGFLFALTEQYLNLKFAKKEENNTKLVKFIFLSLFENFKISGGNSAGEAIFNLTKNHIISENANNYKIGYFFAFHMPSVIIANCESINIWGRYLESINCE